MLIDTKVLKKCRRNRAGIIPYTCFNGKIYFLFAKDRLTGELSDFGGGCKKNEMALDTAIREFKEESNAMFEDALYTHSVYDDTFALSGPKMAIVFLPIYKSWLDTASEKFNHKYNTEVMDVVWIDDSDMINAITNNIKVRGKMKIWTKIQRFIKNLIDPKKLLVILQQGYINTQQGGYCWSCINENFVKV